MDSKGKLRILDANLLYFIGAILFLTLGAFIQSRYFKFGLIFTQYVLILLPPMIYLKAKKISIKKTMRFNKIRGKHVLLIALITILIYPAAVLANASVMLLLSFLGDLNIPGIPTATNFKEYTVLLFIISISAGICEEVFFRGFMLPGYEFLGKRRAILFSAILFGVFHFNVYNLLGPIVLGLVFGYLVLLTDSIYAGMIGHIVNNGFAVTLGYLINFILDKLPVTSDATEEISTTVALLGNLLFFGSIAVITVYIAYKLVGIIKRDLGKGTIEEYDKQYGIVTDDLREDGEGELKTEKVYKTNWHEFIPLILVIPLYFWSLYIQIGEIISLR